eukprot:gnl/Hemi2/10816_TR3706_c0_g1_i1.p1 gnl/Hemi2/10816_TR3706_c0_g1~~gnl/Hemi2/10816_TR3706_c0_g1_i1.p1  ORF type:complete len:542 (-),score=208.18 gnl/Hemi2/10816_TR3706_c0_g1_i1:223-1650(-)
MSNQPFQLNSINVSMENLVEVSFSKLQTILFEVARSIALQTQKIEHLEGEVNGKAARQDVMMLAVATEQAKARIDKMEANLEKEIGRLSSVAKIGEAAAKQLRDVEHRMKTFDDQVKAIEDKCAKIPLIQSEIEILRKDLYSKCNGLSGRLDTAEGKAARLEKLVNTADSITTRLEEIEGAVRFAKNNSIEHDEQIKRMREQIRALTQDMGENGADSHSVITLQNELMQLKREMADKANSELLNKVNSELQTMVKGQEDIAKVVNYHTKQVDELYSAVEKNASVEYVNGSVDKMSKQVRSILDTHESHLNQRVDGLLKFKADKGDVAKLEAMLRDLTNGQNDGMVAGKMQFKCLSCDRGGIPFSGVQPDEVRAAWPEATFGSSIGMEQGRPTMMYGTDGATYKGRRYPEEVSRPAEKPRRPMSAHTASAPANRPLSSREKRTSREGLGVYSNSPARPLSATAPAQDSSPFNSPTK